MAELTKVELFEDRAAVTRRVRVPAGRSEVRLADLTPLIRAEAVSIGGEVSVEDLRITRDLHHRRQSDPEGWRALREASEAADRAAAHAEADHRRAAGRVERAEGLLQAAVEAAGPGLVVHGDAGSLVAAVRELAGRLGALRAAAARAEAEHQARAAHAASLGAQLEALRQGRPAPRAELVVQLVAEHEVDVDVRYVVPCAMWRPAHRAHLSEEGVRWEVRAVCWNATGEDWAGMELVCSTARPGERALPPDLHEDRVVLQPRQAKVVQAREETVQVARRGARDAHAVPGVDDGGEARVYSVVGAELASTGEPVVIPLVSFQGPAERVWRAAPEKSALVVLCSRSTNRDHRPLLAGPVELVRDGVAVGRGRIDLVPPGEPFEVGWGSHESVRLSRRSDHESDRTLITGTQTHTFTAQVHLVHLGESDPIEVEVTERMPVSELKSVSCELVEADPPPRGPDADGMLVWRVSLRPHDRQTLRWVHRVVAASDVQLPW